MVEEAPFVTSERECRRHAARRGESHGAAGCDTDVENEQEVRRSESSSTAAAAKSINTMAAPTSEDDK